MQYIVGTNQNIALYKAMFSSKCGALLCNSKIQKAEKGIPHQIKNPKCFGAYCPSFLLVVELINSLSLYSTALNLAIKYGDKIIAANSNKNPAGIIFISICAIKTIMLVNVKNITFQKLSLLSLEAIKPICGLAAFCNLIALLCASVLQNLVKSSIRTCSNHWFKTHSSIIPKSHHVLKAIMQVMSVFNLYMQRMCNLATPINNYYRSVIKRLLLVSVGGRSSIRMGALQESAENLRLRI